MTVVLTREEEDAIKLIFGNYEKGVGFFCMNYGAEQSVLTDEEFEKIQKEESDDVFKYMRENKDDMLFHMFNLLDSKYCTNKSSRENSISPEFVSFVKGIARFHAEMKKIHENIVPLLFFSNEQFAATIKEENLLLDIVTDAIKDDKFDNDTYGRFIRLIKNPQISQLVSNVLKKISEKQYEINLKFIDSFKRIDLNNNKIQNVTHYAFDLYVKIMTMDRTKFINDDVRNFVNAVVKNDAFFNGDFFKRLLPSKKWKDLFYFSHSDVDSFQVLYDDSYKTDDLYNEPTDLKRDWCFDAVQFLVDNLLRNQVSTSEPEIDEKIENMFMNNFEKAKSETVFWFRDGKGNLCKRTADGKTETFCARDLVQKMLVGQNRKCRVLSCDQKICSDYIIHYIMSELTPVSKNELEFWKNEDNFKVSKDELFESLNPALVRYFFIKFNIKIAKKESPETPQPFAEWLKEMNKEGYLGEERENLRKMVVENKRLLGYIEIVIEFATRFPLSVSDKFEERTTAFDTDVSDPVAKAFNMKYRVFPQQGSVHAARYNAEYMVKDLEIHKVANPFDKLQTFSPFANVYLSTNGYIGNGKMSGGGVSLVIPRNSAKAITSNIMQMFKELKEYGVSLSEKEEATITKIIDRMGKMEANVNQLTRSLKVISNVLNFVSNVGNKSGSYSNTINGEKRITSLPAIVKHQDLINYIEWTMDKFKHTAVTNVDHMTESEKNLMKIYATFLNKIGIDTPGIEKKASTYELIK